MPAGNPHSRTPATSPHWRATAAPAPACTGTLAAGINMPARTTLISALGRVTDDGLKLMPHNDLLQMAGRAGRRGFDDQGNCVIVQNK